MQFKQFRHEHNKETKESNLTPLNARTQEAEAGFVNRRVSETISTPFPYSFRISTGLQAPVKIGYMCTDTKWCTESSGSHEYF